MAAHRSAPSRPGHVRLIHIGGALLVIGGCASKMAHDVPCGGLGEPCCDDMTRCDADLVCSSFTCATFEADAGTTIDDDWSQWSAPPDAPPDTEYTISAGGDTVTDTITGLIWQRVVPANPCSADGTGGCAWTDAKLYCAGLALGGYTAGWRLPTMVELISIVDLDFFDPAINSDAFPATPSAAFWSSTLDAAIPGGAWAVIFDEGETSGFGYTGAGSVRCVRDPV